MEKYVIEVLKGLKAEKVDVKKQRDENDFLFVRDKTKKILVLNRTARDIYNACNETEVGKIIRLMSSKYSGIDKEKISIDALVCLRDLRKRGLITLR